MTRSISRHQTIPVMLGLLLAFSACADQKTEPAEPIEAKAVVPMPTSFLYIAHPVADFDAWLAAYDAHEGVRSEHGMSEFWIYKDLDQEGVVHVLLGVTDVEAARNFVGMEELATVMKDAGVTGEPRMDLMELVDGTAPETIPMSQNHLLIAHEVENWDAWNAAFDAHAGARAEAKLTSRGVARGIDNPNMVYINFAIGDLEAARTFAASDALKNAMKGAGVLGTPLVMFAETARAMSPPTTG